MGFFRIVNEASAPPAPPPPPPPPAGPVDTTTVVTVGPASPAVVGTAVALTATVSPMAPGTVQFTDNGVPIGSPAPISAPTVSRSFAALTVGQHSLAAAFTPTNPGAFNPSTSAGVPYGINPTSPVSFPRTRAFLANRPGDLEGVAGTLSQYDLAVCHPSYASQLPALKAAHPQTRFLMYRNEIACPTGNTDALMSVSWADANTTHPDWFLLDQNGARLVLADFPGSSWMDQGKVAYQNQWARNAIDRCLAEGWHGVFIDDHNSHYTAHLAGGLTVPTYPTETANRLASKAFAENVCAQLRVAGYYTMTNTGFNFAPAGGVTWQQAFTDLGAAPDANCREFWAYDTDVAGGAIYVTTNWDYQQAQMVLGLSLGRGFVPLTYAGSAQVRDYARGSFLLLAPSSGSASMQSAFTVGADPGVPVDPGAPNGSKVAVAGQANCYSRAFVGGTIFVNADTATHTLNGQSVPSGSAIFATSILPPPPPPPPPPPGQFDVRNFDWTSIGPQADPATRITFPTGNGLPLASQPAHTLQNVTADASNGPCYAANIGDGKVIGCAIDGGGINSPHSQSLVRKWSSNTTFVDVDNCILRNSPMNLSDAHNLTNSRLLNTGNDSHTPVWGRQRPHIMDLCDLVGPLFIPVAGRHCDGVQLWKDGHLTMTRVRISGHSNAAIIIKSDNQPTNAVVWPPAGAPSGYPLPADGYTGDCIENILIQDVLLDFTRWGPTQRWNAPVYIRQGAVAPSQYPSSPTNTYRDLHPFTFRRRPNYVTLRRLVASNLADGTRPAFPINTAFTTGDSAIFVQTEALRDRGVANQNANQAAVYAIRKGRGFNDNALDARCWIVLDDCQWWDGSPMIPPGSNPWYDVVGLEG